jgi:hypothetical protein
MQDFGGEFEGDEDEATVQAAQVAKSSSTVVGVKRGTASVSPSASFEQMLTASRWESP